MGDTGTLQYTREFLLNLEAAGDSVMIDSVVLGELVRERESENIGRRKT